MRLVKRRVTQPWCVCKNRKSGYVAWPTLDADLWVHSVCLRPTRMYWEKKIAARRA